MSIKQIYFSPLISIVEMVLSFTRLWRYYNNFSSKNTKRKEGEERKRAKEGEKEEAKKVRREKPPLNYANLKEPRLFNEASVGCSKYSLSWCHS